MQNIGSNFIFTYNSNSPFANEEARNQVPYYDVLYERAQVKYYLDSLESSYHDFESLIVNNYSEKSNCYLWQGTIWVENNKTTNACACFEKAREVASTSNDNQEAEKMISEYCTPKK